MHVQTLDGHGGIALVTRDGSTRCSFAKQAHRSAAHDAFFGSARDVDYRRQRWSEMRRRASCAIDAVTPEQLVELRTFPVDVQVVVGFHSEDPRVTVLDAVDDILRRIHVEVTHPWLPIAQSNSEADQMLAALRAGDEITTDGSLLYGGTLPRAQREARGLPIEPDMVVAALMQTLGASETRRARLDELHTTMRSVGTKGQIRTRFKASLAGSLGLRQFTVPANQLAVAHLTLSAALGLEALWAGTWKNTDREPCELRDAALTELVSDGEPGPASRELAVKAVSHMAAQGWLKRESRDVLGGFRDQRSPDTVLDLMHRDDHGVQVLTEALIAGRRGHDARAVRADASVIEQAAGDVLPVTNQWLRQTFKDTTEAPRSDGTVAMPVTKTPREQVTTYIRGVDRLAAFSACRGGCCG